MFNDYISRKERRGRKGRRVIFLAVNADAGGVAVARDGGRRDDERKTENVDSLKFNVYRTEKRLKFNDER